MIPEIFTLREQYRHYYRASIVAGRMKQHELEDALTDGLTDVWRKFSPEDREWAENFNFGDPD